MEIHQRKFQAQYIANLYKQIGYDRYYERINQCGRYLKYVQKVPSYFKTDSESGDVEVCEGNPEFRLVDGVFCRVRHCPICQWRKSKRWQAIMLKNLSTIQTELPKHRWLFLTLTVKNCRFESLRRTIRHLNKSFRKWVKWKSFPAEGWIKSLEVTIEQNTNSVHPHFHVMLLVPPKYFNLRGEKSIYISQPEWKSSWRRVAKLDYDPMINIKAIKASEERESIFEVLKYSVKPNDLSKINQEQLFHLTNQLNGVHAVNKGGILRKYLKNVGNENVDYIGSSYDLAESTGIELIQRFYPDLNSYEYRLNHHSEELHRTYFELAPFKRVN